MTESSVVSRNAVLKVTAEIQDKHPTRDSIYNSTVVEVNLTFDLPIVYESDWLASGDTIREQMKEVADSVTNGFNDALRFRLRTLNEAKMEVSS